ncbi:terminase small subunit [Streptosporangium saharense]|uniref:terminase small subunit n=1 Tax=Streptosporangium saharense TaxID=1706840 RepID=UPI003F4E1DCF
MPPRRRRLAAAPEPDPRERAPDLRDAVRAAVDAMDWLAPSDQAMRALALRQAEEIEKAIDRAAELAELRRELAGDEGALRRLKALESMCEVTKTVGWLGPQLQGVLRDLGGTPAARKAMKTDKPIGGRLAQLRADAAGEHDS